MSNQKKLHIAVIGVGRMGARHARNLAYNTPRAELVAVVDTNPQALDWAKDNLPQTTHRYVEIQDLFRHPGLQAVLISTQTTLHASLAVQALEAGLHVLMEKPISIEIADSEPVLQAARAHPKQKTMVAFSRRFDESYRQAHSRLSELGDVYLFNSRTNDMFDPTGFFIPYSKSSGGILVDCGIHDIDLARWFLARWFLGIGAGTRQVKKVYASGCTARHPELAEYNDTDNVVAVIEFENGKLATIYLSRTAMHGHECQTEIVGTEGKFVVNQNPRSNRLDIADKHGIRNECTPTYYERFREAFVSEVREFTDACLDDTPLPVTIEDAVEAQKLAAGLTLALRSGQSVVFDEKGFPVEPSRGLAANAKQALAHL